MPWHLRRTTFASKASRRFILLIMWLTRIAGAAFVVASLGFFLVAWRERSIIPAVMAFFPMGFGAFVMSIRATPDGVGLEYGLFRTRR
jgi:hypothetical protein